MCPDGAFVTGDFGGVQAIVYGDGEDAWLAGAEGGLRIRVNSQAGTVHAAGERGPKIAGQRPLYVAWQGDYRQGPKVWFTRMDSDGKFEPQRNLIQGETPGLDEVAIAANGGRVVVLWLDGRGGPDADAPVTSTIWFTVSQDGGKTFGPNKEIKADQKIRACACCSLAASFVEDRLRIVYRSGIKNVRDIWILEGDPVANRWKVQPVSRTGWVFEGCPMDGPRLSGDNVVYTINGVCYMQALGKKPVSLGEGKYPNVLGDLVSVQKGNTITWTSLRTKQTGSVEGNGSRASLVQTMNGPAVVHGK